MRERHVALCAIAKNEARYIAEWLCYHRLIGCDQVFLYDNESDDETLEVVAPFVASGFLSVIPWPSGGRRNPQREAYEHFHLNFSALSDWTMFIDLDEYINLKSHDTVGAFLADYADAPAVVLNWQMFGSSGAQTYSPGLLIERFVRASGPEFTPNEQVKTFVRPACMESIDIHNPKLREGFHPVSTSRMAARPFPNACNDRIEHEVAQINHYFVKSRQEWLIKRDRGKADIPIGDPARIRADAEFEFYDRNDALDNSICRFRSRLVFELVSTIDPVFLRRFYGL
jgi:hypothetical protein